MLSVWLTAGFINTIADMFTQNNSNKYELISVFLLIISLAFIIATLILSFIKQKSKNIFLLNFVSYSFILSGILLFIQLSNSGNLLVDRKFGEYLSIMHFSQITYYLGVFLFCLSMLFLPIAFIYRNMDIKFK